MYVPDHFAIPDESEVLAAIDRRRAGTLVVAGAGGFEASLLPWVLDRRADGTHRLRGHVARANPLAALVRPSARALVVFDLADGYVSPSWYPSKAEDPKVVPTWNYVSAHGRVRAVDDTGWLLQLVTELTERQERGRREPWAVTDAPDDFVARMLRGIVGVQVDVERLEGKAKLSQNRSADDTAGVRRALKGQPGGEALLRAMEAVAR